MQKPSSLTMFVSMLVQASSPQHCQTHEATAAQCRRCPVMQCFAPLAGLPHRLPTLHAVRSSSCKRSEPRRGEHSRSEMPVASTSFSTAQPICLDMLQSIGYQTSGCSKLAPNNRPASQKPSSIRSLRRPHIAACPV